MLHKIQYKFVLSLQICIIGVKYIIVLMPKPDREGGLRGNGVMESWSNGVME